MRKIATVAAVLALVLAGCGGDDEDSAEPQEPTTEEQSASSEADPEDTAAKPAGVSADANADEIAACINDAGVESTVEETGVSGTTTEVEHLFVQLDGFDFGGHLFVFGSEADLATDEKAVAAFGAEGEALGRVFIAYQNPTNPQSEGVDVAKACLPE